MNILDQFEFSVRASNVLRHMGVKTIDDLLAIDRSAVLAQKNAGVRTWKEISEAQEYLRGPTPEMVRENRRRALLSALSDVNSLLDMEPSRRIEMQDGRVYAVEVLRLET